MQRDNAEDTRKGNLHAANGYKRKIIIAESNKSFDCTRMKQKVDGRCAGRSGGKKKSVMSVCLLIGMYNQLRRERVKSGDLGTIDRDRIKKKRAARGNNIYW